MKYNREWLKAQTEVDYLFFWGHSASPDNSIGKTCLSQWWPVVFRDDKHSYPTAEHYMMAEKARLFGDREILAQIFETESPMAAKKLGRRVKNFDPVLWDAHKYNFVKQGNFLKFSQNTPLKNFLLQTGNKVIVEASPRDTIWGIGMSENNINA